LVAALNHTTKTTLTFLFYCLAKHPEIQQKVFEEVEQVVHRSELLGSEDVKNLPYTQSVINESLRLYPTVPFVGRKLNSAITVKGFTFPKDIEVLISPFLMGRNPKYFDDPLTFNPNRFLNLQKPPTGFIPFSIGARKCSGGKIAMNLMKMCVAKIISVFKVSLPKDCVEDLSLRFGLCLATKEKCFLNFEKRN
jgi:cytochrome P450 family 4